ncbi:MAG: amidohydrolase [Bradymonadia bacterium]
MAEILAPTTLEVYREILYHPVRRELTLTRAALTKPVLVVLAACVVGCGGAPPRQETPLPSEAELRAQLDALEHTPLVDTALPALPDAPGVLIRGATVLTAAGDRHSPGWIRLKGGRIDDLGSGEGPEPLNGERVIEAEGRFVTPGLVDTHSHMGVYAQPRIWAHADGNEMTNPVTAGVWSEHGFWPQDPTLQRAVAGGVTTAQILPGSGNLMGGRAVTLKLHPRRNARAMRFPGAPAGLKMACGENPKRVYGKYRKAMPMSRMGSIYMMRDRWVKASAYARKWAKWREDPYTKNKKGQKTGIKPPPDRDLVLETLSEVLAGRVLVHVHCYRADEMLTQLQLAREFGYSIRSFHHAVEAYKISDVLAKANVSVSTWADWWGFKIEAYDAVEQNLALVHAAGGRAILHTDSPEGIQRMNQEAAKGLYAGRRAGLKITEDEALQWLTLHPAWALGIHEQTGTLEKGKMADVVIWDGHPFSVYTRAQYVFIDGHQRHGPGATETWSDFEVGHPAAVETP